MASCCRPSCVVCQSHLWVLQKWLNRSRGFVWNHVLGVRVWSCRPDLDCRLVMQTLACSHAMTICCFSKHFGKTLRRCELCCSLSSTENGWNVKRSVCSLWCNIELICGNSGSSDDLDWLSRSFRFFKWDFCTVVYHLTRFQLTVLSIETSGDVKFD